MADLLHYIRYLSRPRLLVQAARHGGHTYSRKRDLSRLTGQQSTPDPHRIIKTLIDQERDLEASRKDGCTTYSFARHIEILAALMAELRLSTP